MKGRIYLLFVFILLLQHAALAQHVKVLNANIQNGLPANHVYSGLIDKDGYMWLATTKGVVCYNGYTFRTYTTADGLSENDVWGLHCDRKNRIWLKSLSKKFGYIYQGKYHSVRTPGIDILFYPRHVSDYNDGVFFTTGLTRMRTIVFVERDDTLRQTNVLEGLYYGNERAELTRCDIWGFDRYDFSNGKIGYKKACDFAPDYSLGDQTLSNNFRQFFTYHTYGGDVYKLLDYKTCKATELKFGENIYFSDDHGDALYVFTKKYIYKYDSLINVTERFPVSLLSDANLKIVGKDVTNIIDNNKWGRYITTKVNGLYNVIPTDDVPVKRVKELEDYSFSGSIGDSVSFWWNIVERRLLRINKDGRWTSTLYPSVETIRYIAPWNDSEGLAMGMRYPMKIVYRTGELKSISNKLKRMSGLSVHDSAEVVETIITSTNSVWLGDNSILALVKAQGLHKLQVKGDTLSVGKLFKGRFAGVEPDKKRNGLWLYNRYGVIFYSIGSGSSIHVSDSTLSYFGIRDLEKVMLDTAGNIYVKDKENVYALDLARYKKRRLFAGYNVVDNICFLHKNVIGVVGRGGLLFAKISGLNRFSAPMGYRNIRRALYQDISKVVYLDNKIWLLAENGWHEADFPADSAYKHAANFATPYNALLYYNDSLLNLHKQQYVRIKQSEPLLRFDIVNPLGNGQLRYTYRLGDSAWQTLTGNELYLPQLKPGKEYRLSLAMYDDVWRSKQFNLTLYITPYWWQTPLWVGVFWITGTLVVIGLLIVVVLVTRHYTAKESDKKRLLTDLELRAIYSQLNPHFIFNTLNTTTYFIKKGMLDAALNHISKFAQLLRTYLESTRERHIFIADEIRNLSNYIELQQVRFGNRFTYNISVADDIEIERIQIPSLLIQPFVENAINHGLIPKDDDGHLNITFRKNEAGVGIICVIEDDGIGRERSAATLGARFDNKKSYGNDMIRELINIFNKYEQTDIAIDYEDKIAHGSGTIVTITINNPTYGF